MIKLTQIQQKFNVKCNKGDKKFCGLWDVLCKFDNKSTFLLSSGSYSCNSFFFTEMAEFFFTFTLYSCVNVVQGS